MHAFRKTEAIILKVALDSDEMKAFDSYDPAIFKKLTDVADLVAAKRLTTSKCEVIYRDENGEGIVQMLVLVKEKQTNRRESAEV